MYVQVIQYHYDGDAEAFMQHAESLASTIAALDGFVAKLWLDGEGTRFGGVYVWRDRAAADAYRYGDLFTAAVVEPPEVRDLTVTGYDLWAQPTRTTSGGLRIAA